MENRINMAELLKDCPTGMELDCTIFDNVSFVGLQDSLFPIIIHTPDGCKFLTHFGCYHNSCSAKCVIFPKGKTTWEGFGPHCKFKDGDIVAHQNHMGTWIGIYHKHDYLNETFSSYCCIRRDRKFWADFNNYHGYDKTRLATKEEKAKLFQAIKDNGYKWNAETKTLEKLVVPEFKVGDKITNGKTSITIGYIDDEYYYEIGRNVANRLFIKNQDNYELVPNKFDIHTLKPFDKVLVRDENTEEWRAHFFSHYRNTSDRPYICIGIEGLNEFKKCIPFKGNEHLRGKTDNCNDFYKTW